MVSYLHVHGGYGGVDKSVLFAGFYRWLLERAEDAMPWRVFERTP